MSQQTIGNIAMWGGLECTINRVHDRYMDQLIMSDHYTRRTADIGLFKSLHIKALRYPALWEKHVTDSHKSIDWIFTAQALEEIVAANIEPIVGLVHHGSGPAFTSFFDDTFAHGLADYAAAFAQQFPQVSYYTPVNEPLTTARFCGLYGLWFPHGQSAASFFKVLLAECKATVLAMQAIRKVNPAALLVQTEDLGKTHATHTLQYQADYENERRWLSFDLLCGKVDQSHPLWQELINEGIPVTDLDFFLQNPCPPDILGLNHYVTSERYLDENTTHYPAECIGGNGRHRYADIEAVRANKHHGPAVLIREAWDRYHIPIAITEVHLHCTREEQLRWMHNIWTVCNSLTADGVDIKAITAWALLGSFDWCSLLTRQDGVYEPGLFDIRSNTPRPTALTQMVATLAQGQSYHHPVLEQKGWWDRPEGAIYKKQQNKTTLQKVGTKHQPLIIIGSATPLAQALIKVCQQRALCYVTIQLHQLKRDDGSLHTELLFQHRPWAIINATDYNNIDDAEQNRTTCLLLNSEVPRLLADACAGRGLPFVTFSSDLVFDGKKQHPYVESDYVAPLSVYGQSKALAEAYVQQRYADALVIRTSAAFGPWDNDNFVHKTLCSLTQHQSITAANDIILSPTYLPDLIHTTLDLLLDGATGIWNISNKGSLSWGDFAGEIARRSGHHHPQLQLVSFAEMNHPAQLPAYSVLHTEKGCELPPLDNALERFFRDQQLIAV